MSIKCGNDAKLQSPADLLSDKLSAVVKEHFELLQAHRDTLELDHLRAEVYQLREEIRRLNQETANPKQGDSQNPTTSSIWPQLSFANTDSDVFDLRSKLQDLDPEKRGYIDIDHVADHITEHLNCNNEAKMKQMQKYRDAVHMLNRRHELRTGISHDLTAGCIHYSTFEVLMLEDVGVWHSEFGPQATEALIGIRESIVHDELVRRIAGIMRIGKSYEVAKHGKCSIKRFLEPTVAAMIILNAVQIGFSLDVSPEWNGWFVFETFFMCFFVMEFAVRVSLHGCTYHFFGEDRHWNWFDFVIVCLAVLDTMITALAKVGVTSIDSVNLNHLLVIRLARLVRITRIIRLLRLRLFRELALMMNGVVSGLRTLFWSFVLLTMFIYAFALLMRQMMDPSQSKFRCEMHPLENEFAAPSPGCNRGASLLDQQGRILFGNVPRSMLSIFLCFTADCGSADGTPLIWLLWDTHGPLLVLGYIAAFLFVSFGVLNLIAAVFVEKTLANAQRHNAKRHYYDEASKHVKTAQKLQMLLGKLLKATPDRERRNASDGSMQGQDAEQGRYPDHLHMQIAQDEFEEILADHEVNRMLDDLDVSCVRREKLFDILDSDGNGFLSIGELVDGIMKLRGPADKGDGVATLLMVRKLQKQVSKCEFSMQQQIKLLDGLYKRRESQTMFRTQFPESTRPKFGL